MLQAIAQVVDSDPTTARPDASDAEDVALVARARAGDRAAAALIYQRHARYVGRLATWLSDRREDADDAVQDTFTTALTRLDDLRDGGALRVWLGRVCVRHCQRRHRRRRLMRALGLDRSVDDVSLDELCAPGADGETRAELQRIQAVISRLPHDQRTAWALHRVEGETLEAVAALGGCSLATVKRRIAAVEERLDRHLQRREETP